MFVQICSIVGFLSSCGYLVYGLELNRQSLISAGQQWEEKGSLYSSLRSYPTLFQPYLRHLVLRTKEHICVGSHTVPYPQKTIKWQCTIQLPNECAKKLINTSVGQRFVWFTSKDFRAEVIDRDLIRFHDLRYPLYEDPTQGLWGIEGSCSSLQPSLRYFHQKITFSRETLLKLLSLWRAEDKN